MLWLLQVAGVYLGVRLLATSLALISLIEVFGFPWCIDDSDIDYLDGFFD